MVGGASSVTALIKWMYKLPSINSKGEFVCFNHPFLLCTVSFLGELFCIGVYYPKRRWQQWKERKDLKSELTSEIVPTELTEMSELVKGIPSTCIFFIQQNQ